MRTHEKSPPSPLAHRSQVTRAQARKEQQESLWLRVAASRCSRDKSSELSRQSDELLRRSRKLRDQLRNIYNAH